MTRDGGAFALDIVGIEEVLRLCARDERSLPPSDFVSEGLRFTRLEGERILDIYPLGRINSRRIVTLFAG